MRTIKIKFPKAKDGSSTEEVAQKVIEILKQKWGSIPANIGVRA